MKDGPSNIDMERALDQFAETYLKQSFCLDWLLPFELQERAGFFAQTSVRPFAGPPRSSVMQIDSLEALDIDHASKQLAQLFERAGFFQVRFRAREATIE